MTKNINSSIAVKPVVRVEKSNIRKSNHHIQTMKKILSALFIATLSVCFATKTVAATMAIDSLSGAITANEIAAFKNYMATTTIATNNAGNAWLFGSSGKESQALGIMYEATGDTGILDRMIQYSDIALAGRNNPTNGVVMWTGNRELCWPNSFNEPVYTSCESGEVIHHILHCARLILQTPSIWNNTVTVGDPHGYGTTYKARALTYLTECDKTIDTFIIPIWVNPAQGNRIYAPTDWNGDGGANGGPVAWNRISMFLAGLQNSAECHEILGDDPSKVAQLDAIVQTNINWFLTKAVPYTKNGFSCYNWFYRADTTSKYEEVWEDHGALDIRMLWESYNRGIGLSKTEMTKFANTIQYSVWASSSNVFHGRFDGNDGTYGTHTYTKGEYIRLGDYVPAVYTTVATADKSHTTDPSMVAPILWMKNRVYQEFSVFANPGSQFVNAGSGTSYTVNVAPMGGFTGSVTMSASGLPSGATASFNHSPINLAQLNVPSTNVTMTISTGTSTPAGSYTITVTGTNGSISHSDTVTLIVADYSISATPLSQTTTCGNFTSYTVNSSDANGFSGSISLSASGLPSGANASFNPTSITAGNSSTMTVTTSISTPGSTNTVTIKGTSGSVNRTANVTLTVKSAGGALPSGWTDADIGSPGFAGSAGYASGVFTLNGSGADIWGTSDQLNYAYQSISGDLTTVARVVSQDNTASWAKSGVMIRETTAANSSYVGVYVTPGNGVSIQYRNGTGAGAIDLARQSGVAAPYWVKLVRSGNTFSGYSSPDGSTWTFVGSTNVTMAANVTAGLLVCSHDNTQFNTSTFDNVSLTTPDFSVSATPNSQTVTAGGSTNFTASASAINGFSSTITWSVTGLPTGATGNFNPTTINGSGSSTLTVTTSTSTPAGTNTLTVIGTSGSLQHTDTVTLIVKAFGPAPGSNLALNKTATASSIWSSSYDASKAVDGSDSSRWSAASGQTSNQWVLIDFGAATSYNRVVLKEISFQRVTSFKIQSSNDGTTFTDLFSGTTIGASNTVTFAQVTSRYVRLLMPTASGVPTINEIQVYQDVQLFQNTSYGGWFANYPLGTYTTAQLVGAGGVDNDASSMRVPPGMKVTLYTNDNFTGTNVVETADDSSLIDNGMNDAVSSLKVETN